MPTLSADEIQSIKDIAGGGVQVRWSCCARGSSLNGVIISFLPVFLV